MDCSDVIAIIAIGISVFNLCFMIWQNRINESALETQIRTDMNSIIFEMNNFTTLLQQNQNNNVMQSAYFAIEEKYRNAYEDLCQKYYTKKIDKKWVEKMYKEEIKALVESDNQREYYKDIQSKYTYTVKAYKDWFKTV